MRTHTHTQRQLLRYLGVQLPAADARSNFTTVELAHGAADAAIRQPACTQRRTLGHLHTLPFFKGRQRV